METEDRRDLLKKAGAVAGAAAVAGAGVVGMQVLDDDSPVDLQMDEQQAADSDTDVRIGSTSPGSGDDSTDIQASRNARMLEQMSSDNSSVLRRFEVHC